jgi:hypothetical protein
VNVAAKLAGFGAGLVVLFGGAALAGGAAGPLHDTPKQSDDPMGMHATPHAVRGLAVSDDGLTLALARGTAAPGRRFALAFRITNRDGETVKDFDVEHTKRMHVIVVRRDMTGFEHLHPTQRADGTWTVPAALRDAGSYRVFADFSTGGKPRTLAGDITVDGTLRSRALPAPTNTATVDGLTVALTKRGEQLDFAVTRGGRPVALQDYLGAKGHLVALRQGDLAFLHVHPDERRLRFMAEFPTAGTYRLFLQFKTDDGRVHTAAFTQEVGR